MVIKKYKVHQLRIEGSEHFGFSTPIAVCEKEEDAQRIADSMNKNHDENVLFAFGVVETVEGITDDKIEELSTPPHAWKDYEFPYRAGFKDGYKAAKKGE